MTESKPTPGEAPRALAEPTGFVEVYRRVLSPQTRRAIATKVSPRARHQLKQWVARAARDGHLSERRGERLARRQPELLAGADRVVVTADRGPRVARIGAAVTPLMARLDNLTTVTAALDEAGVPHFRVRGESHRSSVVAVDAEHRARAYAALAAACGRIPGYVGVPDDTGQPAAGFEPKTWDRLADAPVLRLTWYWTDPSGGWCWGRRTGATSSSGPGTVTHSSRRDPTPSPNR